jgi:hypothetical protein
MAEGLNTTTRRARSAPSNALTVEARNLGLHSVRQRRSRAMAQNLCQRIGKRPWLGELDHRILGHGVSLLQWRSGGFEHPTIRRLTPSSRHQLPRIARPNVSHVNGRTAASAHRPSSIRGPRCVGSTSRNASTPENLFELEAIQTDYLIYRKE